MARFLYHFEPKKGWMNDPNGLVYFKGFYHAFFQHNPYDIKWGPMHWGHAISDDLVDWRELDIALIPDKEYEDDGGCFSGSALVIDNKLYLFYTSVSKKYGQAQSIAVSEDGFTFTKYSGNPVITIPKFLDTIDFRDPKVFKYKDEYRMILGTKLNGMGAVVQYKSKDILNWEYVGILYSSNRYDGPIECPDLFYLGDKWILMYSMCGMIMHQVDFMIGEFDGEVFTEESHVMPEGGPQYYASQTFEQASRRIMIGWFYDWKYEETDVLSRGALSIPRELKYNGYVFTSYPVKECRYLLKSLVIGSNENQSSVKGIEIYAYKDSVIIKSSCCEDIIYKGNINTVEILEDVKAIEVFINGGVENYSIYR